MLFLVATGRSGSVFVHSLLDGHPQILSYPMTDGFYTGAQQQHFASAEEAIAYLSTGTQLRHHLRGAPDAILGRLLIDDQPADLHIDGTRLFALLREELPQRQSFDRPTLLVAFHRAFGRYRGQSLANVRLILEHVHHPAALARARADFPQAYCLNTVREPKAALTSKLRAMQRDFSHFKHRNFYIHLRDCFLAGWRLIQEHSDQPDERVRTLALPDVHARGAHGVAELCRWLGIDDHPAAHTSSFAGYPWEGNSTQRKRSHGFDPNLGKRAPVDRSVAPLVEASYVPAMARYGCDANEEEHGERTTVQRLTRLLRPLPGEFSLRLSPVVENALTDADRYPLDAVLARTLAQLGARVSVHPAADGMLHTALLQLLVAKRLLWDPGYYYAARLALMGRTMLLAN